MLTPRLSNCRMCANISNLLSTIDAKIAMEANKLYQNLTLMLNKPVDRCLISDLTHYSRILKYKCINEDYAKCFELETIASKIREKTVGIDKDCGCQEYYEGSETDPTTTTTTTSTTVAP